MSLNIPVLTILAMQVLDMKGELAILYDLIVRFVPPGEACEFPVWPIAHGSVQALLEKKA